MMIRHPPGKPLLRVTAYWERVEYQVYHYTLLTARSQILLNEGRSSEASLRWTESGQASTAHYCCMLNS